MTSKNLFFSPKLDERREIALSTNGNNENLIPIFQSPPAYPQEDRLVDDEQWAVTVSVCLCSAHAKYLLSNE